MIILSSSGEVRIGNFEQKKALLNGFDQHLFVCEDRSCSTSAGSTTSSFTTTEASFPRADTKGHWCSGIHKHNAQRERGSKVVLRDMKNLIRASNLNFGYSKMLISRMIQNLDFGFHIFKTFQFFKCFKNVNFQISHIFKTFISKINVLKM